jgi:hypothetical protein
VLAAFVLALLVLVLLIAEAFELLLLDVLALGLVSFAAVAFEAFDTEGTVEEFVEVVLLLLPPSAQLADNWLATSMAALS